MHEVEAEEETGEHRAPSSVQEAGTGLLTETIMLLLAAKERDRVLVKIVTSGGSQTFSFVFKHTCFSKKRQK